MTLTEARTRLGALEVQLTAFELSNGTNASRYTTEQLHEQNRLLNAIIALRVAIESSSEHQKQNQN